MSAAQIQKYAMNLLFVAIAIGVLNTITKRVPVVGPLVGQVMTGL